MSEALSLSLSGSAGPGLLAHPDPDRLLADYRAALAQAALFEAGGSRSRLDPVGHDEFVDPNGEVRPGWSELAEVVGERGALGLDRLADTVTALVDRDGISYIAVDENGDEGNAAPRPWHLDSLPLLIAPEDWAKLEQGVAQRSRMLDAVLADLTAHYGRSPKGCCPRSCCSPTRATCGPPGESRFPVGTNCSCTPATSAETRPERSWSTPTGHSPRRVPDSR